MIIDNKTCLSRNGCQRFHPEDRVVFSRVRLESVLKLLEITLVCQIEMRSRDEGRGFHLALSHVLKSRLFVTLIL